MSLKKILFLFLLFTAKQGFCQNTSPADTFPEPKGIPYQLFYLQRQPNPNTIVVELNVVNGRVDEDDPVNVFWIRFGEQGQKKSLSFIQRTFAYGVKSKKIKDGSYLLHFVSYKELKIRLEREANNNWRSYYDLGNGSAMILKRIYLHINGGSFWHPNVEYVELKGRDPVTNVEIRKRISVK